MITRTICPGCWVDEENEVNIAPEKLLPFLGLPITEANCNAVVAAVVSLVESVQGRRLGPIRYFYADEN